MWKSFLVDGRKRYYAQRELQHPHYKILLYEPETSQCYIEILHKCYAVQRAETINHHLVSQQHLEANQLNETLLRGIHDAATEYRYEEAKNLGTSDSNRVDILLQLVYKQPTDGQYFRFFWQLRQATHEEFCDALLKPALQSISEMNRQVHDLRGALVERERKPWQRCFDFVRFDAKYEVSTAEANSLMRLGGTNTMSPIRSASYLLNKNAIEALRTLKLDLTPLRRELAMQMKTFPLAMLPNDNEEQSKQKHLNIFSDHCKRQQQQHASKEGSKKKEKAIQEIQSNIRLLHANPDFKTNSDLSSSSDDEKKGSHT